MTSFIDLEKTDGIAFPARAYNFLPQKAEAARSIRTASEKPYEVVEGKPPFPARKNAANPGGRLAAFGRAAFSLHIILTVPIVTWVNLRHNRKTVPVLCGRRKNVCHNRKPGRKQPEFDLF